MMEREPCRGCYELLLILTDCVGVCFGTKLERLSALIRLEHRPETHSFCSESPTYCNSCDEITICAGCGVDLDEVDCPYLTIINEQKPEESELPF